MRKYSGVMMMFLIGWLVTISCVDNNNDGCTTLPVDENGEISKTFILQLPSPIQAASTYAMQVDDENRINTLDVILFSVDQGDETYAYRVQATSIRDVGNDSHYKEATIKLKADGKSYRLVFLANVTDEIDSQLIDIATVGEKDPVMKRLTHTFAADKTWGNGDAFAMWGESNVVTISDETSLDNEEIKMLRAVSRIDVIAQGLNNFELTSAHVYKYHRKGHVVPDPDKIGADKKAHTPTVPVSEEALIVDKSERFAAANDNTIMQEIYVYESEASDIHLEKTCVVVGGVYVPEGYTGNIDDLKPSYYRIDMVDENQKDIPLLRNHCYTLRIKSVNGGGYEDEDKAYESPSFNVDVEIMEWDQGDITDIVFGQYFLGVSRSEIYMPAPADRTSIIVTTDYLGGWTATYQSTGNWLTGPSTAFTYPKQKDELFFDLKENDTGVQRIGYIHLQAGVLRHTIIVYQDIDDDDGPPTDVEWLKNVGEANCYILSPSGDGIRIPVSQANKDGVSRIGSDDELEVEVLWTDTKAAIGEQGCVLRYVGVEGKGDTGYLEVVASKTVWGNALVAVKVNNEIRWSWHIWVLEYTPDQTAIKYPKTNTLITLMDRNLGALSATPGDAKTIGLTYQWGRKDPFPGADAFASSATGFKIYDAQGIETHITYTGVITTNTNMLEESIKDPMEFIRGYTGGAKDWFTSNYNNMNDKLWENINSTTVSPYDPCPDGWTIDISRSFWDSNNYAFIFDFDNYQHGGNSDQIGFWPTGGFRAVDGSFNNSEADVSGYYWMGQANGGDANAIKIQKNLGGAGKGLGVGYPNSRGMGLSVRCKKM